MTEIAIAKKNHLITNKIVWIKQSCIRASITFLSAMDVVSVVFNISSSHFNSNLSKRCFLHSQLLIPNYLPIQHALSHSQSHVLGFHA